MGCSCKKISDERGFYDISLPNNVDRASCRSRDVAALRATGATGDPALKALNLRDSRRTAFLRARPAPDKARNARGKNEIAAILIRTPHSAGQTLNQESRKATAIRGTLVIWSKFVCINEQTYSSVYSKRGFKKLVVQMLLFNILHLNLSYSVHYICCTYMN